MPKRSKAEWLSLIEQHDSSGLSAAEFCRRYSIDAKYFSLRKRQLGGSPTGFVQVKTPIDESVTKPQTVTVRILQFDVPLSELTTSLSQFLVR